MLYKFSSALRTGRYHRFRDEECADKIATCRDAEVFAVALADGAGSCEFGALGAELVTERVAAYCHDNFAALYAMDKNMIAATLLHEALAALTATNKDVMTMSCTLLFFAADKAGRCLAGHLGDGIMIKVNEDNVASVFSLPENGQNLNETYFVTGQNAMEHFRIYQGLLEKPGALLLMSDGLAGSFYSLETKVPAAACGQIAKWLHGADEEVINRALDDNMDRVLEERSNDDLSLGVVCWQHDPGANAAGE